MRGADELVELLINRFGFCLKFKEYNILNPLLKIKFLEFKQKFHNIYFLTHTKLPNIEIVEYERTLKRINSLIHLSFPDVLCKDDAYFGNNVFYSRKFNIFYHISEKPIIFIPNEIPKKLRNLLGLSLEKDCINFIPPFANCEFKIRIKRIGELSINPKLDYLGPNMIAFVTNKVIDIENKFSITVNDKHFYVNLFPVGGYFVEILKIINEHTKLIK